MRIDVIKNIDMVDASAWNALAQANGTHTIYQTYEFNRIAEEVYGRKDESFILCVKDNTGLVAVFPLMLVTVKGKRVLQFMAGERSDYCDILCSSRQDEVFELVWEYIFSRHKEWDFINLVNLPLESGLVRYIKENKDIKNLSHRSSQDEAECLSFTKDPAHTQEVLHKKKVLGLRHYFQSHGDYKVLHLHGRDQIEGHLEGFFAQHIERWKGSLSPSLFLNGQAKEFYRRMVQALPQEWITFTMLQWNGQVLGYHLGFSYGKRFIWYKPTFNVAFAAHSPGQVLLQEVMEHAYAQGFEEFDFGVGTEAYKNRFGNMVSYNNSFRIYPSKGAYLGYYLPVAIQWRVRRLFSKLSNPTRLDVPTRFKLNRSES